MHPTCWKVTLLISKLLIRERHVLPLFSYSAGISFLNGTFSPKLFTIERFFTNHCSLFGDSTVLRDHPFKTSANFHDFWPLPPYHWHSSKMLMKGIFDPYVLWPLDHHTWGHPSPPKTCWRLKWTVSLRIWTRVCLSKGELVLGNPMQLWCPLRIWF